MKNQLIIMREIVTHDFFFCDRCSRRTLAIYWDGGVFCALCGKEYEHENLQDMSEKSTGR